jgi:hypothetical protein
MNINELELKKTDMLGGCVVPPTSATNLRVNTKQHPDFFPYQLAGGAFLAYNGPVAFLFDQQGLGKTWQAILALDLIGWDEEAQA